MFIRKILLCLSTLFLAGHVYAQETGELRGERPQVTGGSALYKEKWGIKPQIGYMNYVNAVEGSTSRGAIGVMAEYNGLKTGAYTEAEPKFYFGGVSGIVYSQVGKAGANFYGANSTAAAGNSSAYALEIPLNVKYGYNVRQNVRLSARAGGNLIYRSVADTMDLGTPHSTDARWDLFPNIGGDAEFGLTENTGLLIRPDLTFAASNSVFTGTIGLFVAL